MTVAIDPSLICSRSSCLKQMTQVEDKTLSQTPSPEPINPSRNIDNVIVVVTIQQQHEQTSVQPK
jgi:hypothetical protein